MNINKYQLISINIFLSLFSIINVAHGAVLYLEPSSGEYQPGDTFMVAVKIDTEGDCINAVEVNLAYDKDILQAVDFGRGESILNIWVKSPEISQEQGLVSFSGGIPGGYCGRLPGDPGQSNLLGKLIFQIKKLVEDGPLQVKFLDTCQVLLNDGLGTPAKLTIRGATIKITGVRPLEVPKDEWQKELAEDTIPPEPFEIEIHRDSLIFDGKYFIVFSTTDKQTGIDFFEIKEGKRDWKKAESPYLLADQELKSIIKVKAVDKARNERIAEYLPEIAKKPFPWRAILAVAVGLLIIGWIVKKYLIPKP